MEIDMAQPHGRTFIRSALVVDGRSKAGYLIRCRECNKAEVIPNATHSGSLPPEVTAKKFAQKGWRVGSRVREDRCPDCIAQEMELKKKKKEPKTEEEVLSDIKMEIDNVKAEAPPLMTKEDRRIIFAEIDSHYVDEMRGYEAGWDDAKVAQGLNVPMSWVRQLREDNFGPEVGESVKKDFEEAKVIIAKGDMIIGNMNKALDNVAQSIQTWQKIQAGFEKEVAETKRAIEELTKRINALTKK
jgi:hypothetical protein